MFIFNTIKTFLVSFFFFPPKRELTLYVMKDQIVVIKNMVLKYDKVSFC